MILISLLSRVRPDVKIMANYLLGRIPELAGVLLPVDPFGSRHAVIKNMGALREAFRWLGEGHLLAVFPAGSVSHINLRQRRIVDPEWNAGIARIVRRSRARVVPVFFDGANSLFFQIAGMVHPKLRTALLPREFLNKGKRVISVRIGNVIPSRKSEAFEDDEKLIGYLRMRTYVLKHRCPGAANRREGMAGENLTLIGPQGVPRSIEAGNIYREVESLPSRQLLTEADGFAVLFAKANQIPNLLFEIGRLREVTFRKAGEGTGREVDLSRFDLYYTHLFVWNRRKNEVVGAYRLGQVDLILDRFGKKGLYTNTLFDLKDGFLEHVSQGVELGRSFVREEYQRLVFPAAFAMEGHCPFRSGQSPVQHAFRPGYHKQRLFRPFQTS